jgi:hypothetical protein
MAKIRHSKTNTTLFMDIPRTITGRSYKIVEGSFVEDGNTI